jgi:hypothetical protein
MPDRVALTDAWTESSSTSISGFNLPVRITLSRNPIRRTRKSAVQSPSNNPILPEYHPHYRDPSPAPTCNPGSGYRIWQKAERSMTVEMSERRSLGLRHSHSTGRRRPGFFTRCSPPDSLPTASDRHHTAGPRLPAPARWHRSAWAWGKVPEGSASFCAMFSPCVPHLGP